MFFFFFRSKKNPQGNHHPWSSCTAWRWKSPVVLRYAVTWIHQSATNVTGGSTVNPGHMAVSENRDTKWMVYNGNPYKNRGFGCTTIFGNIHICTPQPPTPRGNESRSDDDPGLTLNPLKTNINGWKIPAMNEDVRILVKIVGFSNVMLVFRGVLSQLLVSKKKGLSIVLVGNGNS